MQAHVAKRGRAGMGPKILLPGATENIDPGLSASYDLPVVFLSTAIS